MRIDWMQRMRRVGWQGVRFSLGLGMGGEKKVVSES